MRRWTNKSVTWAPQPPPQLPVTPSILGWYSTFNSPFPNPGTGNSTFSWVPLGTPLPPIGWYVQWQAPTLPAPGPTYAFTAWGPQVVTQTGPPWGWYTSWQAPVLPAPQPTYNSTAWNPEIVVLPVTPTSLGWYQQFQAPVLTAPSVTYSSTSWDPQVITHAAVTTTWFWVTTDTQNSMRNAQV